MRVDELMRYSRAFYPGWDDAYADELRQMFALDPMAKIKTLSRGQKARAGLLVQRKVEYDRRQHPVPATGRFADEALQHGPCQSTDAAVVDDI